MVLSAVGARCGRTFRSAGHWSSIANTIKLIPDKDLRCGAAWLYLATSDPDLWPKRGSAQPFVSIKDARGVQVLVADGSTALRFESVVGSLNASSEALSEAVRSVAVMRNLLLPKLVSGEIDVSSLDLDELVEESVA